MKGNIWTLIVGLLIMAGMTAPLILSYSVVKGYQDRVRENIQASRRPPLERRGMVNGLEMGTSVFLNEKRD